jgi:cellulose synthase/poly-beta-1,6-N-acetylglucosamine synthase-like glycosyltransferase
MPDTVSELEKSHGYPDITVAVCVRNGESTLRSCLDSLMALNYPKEKLAYLVVDNGSTDATPDILARYPVTVIHESRPGRGHARNAACRHCSTAVLAFTDADCRVTTNWLQDVTPLFEDPSVGIAGGKIITPGDDPLARFYELRQIVSNREFSGNYPYSPPFLATANALFRVEAIRQAGGFRTHYRVAEDADICWRIQRNGWKLIYVDAGTVYHDHRTSRAALFSQAVDYGYDGVAVYLEFYSLTHPWIWWGLYYRWLMALLKLPAGFLKKDAFYRQLPVLDLIRYSGLAKGRICAGIASRRLIM